jgi:hypothetical protein
VAVMDVGHVTVLVLGARVLMLMGMYHIGGIVGVEFIMAVPVLVDDRLVDMKMSVLLA